MVVVALSRRWQLQRHSNIYLLQVFLVSTQGTYIRNTETDQYSLMQLDIRNEFISCFSDTILTWVWAIYTVYREICTPDLSPLSPSSSAEKFNTGQILISQIIPLKTQLCLGKFKTGRNRSQVKKGENNTMTLIAFYTVLIKIGNLCI